MKQEELRKEIEKIFYAIINDYMDAPTATNRLQHLLDSQRPKDESIEQRGKEYSEKAHADGFSTYAELQAAFIAGAESQDALRSEEVEKLKQQIFELGIESNESYFKLRTKLQSRLSSLTAICDKMENRILTIGQELRREDLTLKGQVTAAMLVVVECRNGVLAEYAFYKNSRK